MHLGVPFSEIAKTYGFGPSYCLFFTVLSISVRFGIGATIQKLGEIHLYTSNGRPMKIFIDTIDKYRTKNKEVTYWETNDTFLGR